MTGTGAVNMDFSDYLASRLPYFFVAVLAHGVEPASAVVNQVIPVTVRVTDQRGIPVPDVFVKWIAGDGSGVTATAPHPTDADGLAHADWFIGPTAKRYTLSAHAIVGEGSAQRTAAVTTFSVLATAPAPN